jgi:hypothetical protein
MKKTIKKIGNSLGIIFNKEECKIYNFKKDDTIELDDTILIKAHRGKGGCWIYYNLPEDIQKYYENESKKLNISVEEILKRNLLDSCRKIIKIKAKKNEDEN